MIDKIDLNNDSNHAASHFGQSSENSVKNKLKLKQLPSSGWRLDISVYYDDSMLKHFKNDDNTTKRFINRIIKQTQPIFDRDSSFPTKVELNVLEIRHAPGHSWKANEATIQNISKVPDFFEQDSPIYIFFCMPQEQDNTFGIVRKLGSMCGEERSERITIVESYLEEDNNEISAAVTVAHEIGHLFGIRHDFYSNGWPRFVELNIDKGYPCSNKGGIMDKLDFSRRINDHKWTKCSQSDLLIFYNDIISKGKFCLERLPNQERDEYAKEGEHVRLTCLHNCPKTKLFGFTWSKHSSNQHHRILTHIVLPKSRGIMYSLKNIEKIDKSNIFIDPTISDGDLMIRNTRTSDEGDYLCDVKCSDPNFKETQIIKLHVEKGKNKWK